MASPIGSMVPSSAAAGSVVARPSASSAQPSGIGSPRLAAGHDAAARHHAERGVDHQGRAGASAARRTRSGWCRRWGCAPPHGAMAAGEFEKASADQPALRQELDMVARSRRHGASCGSPRPRRPACADPGGGRIERRARSPGRRSRCEASTRRPPGAGPLEDGHRPAVDLARPHLVGIGRQAREAVAADPVGLGRDQRGDGGGDGRGTVPAADRTARDRVVASSRLRPQLIVSGPPGGARRWRR